jgi:uncharacterized membrane protein
MMLGWWLADLFARPAAERRRELLTIGGAAVYGFVCLRLANLYGDPTPWASQATPTLTVLSWLNGAKYPPSLCYLPVTPGPAPVARFKGTIETRRYRMSYCSTGLARARRSSNPQRCEVS